MKKKKILAAFLAVLMCLSLFVMTAFAKLDDDDEDPTQGGEGQDDPTVPPTEKDDYIAEVVCDYTPASDFSTLSVDFVIMDNEDITGAFMRISYDSSKIAFSYASGTFCGSAIRISNQTPGMISINYDSASIVSKLTGIFTLHFDVINPSSTVNINLSGSCALPNDSPHKSITLHNDTTVWFCNHPTTHMVIAKEATCKASGTQNEVCSTCGKVLAATNIPIGPHTISEIPIRTENPTCDMEGYTEYKCIVCSKLVTDKLPKQHTYAVGSKKVASNGVWWQTCKVCGDQSVSDTQCAHDESNYVLVSVITKPTCLNNGKGKYECSVCHAQAELAIVAKHTFEFARTLSLPTYATKGEDLWICSGCGLRQIHYTTSGGEHTNHTFNGKEEIITPASCTAAGKKKVYCSFTGCTEFKEVEIPKTGHTFGEWTITKAATCAAEGSRTSTCKICKQNVTETIAKLAHAYGAETTVNPTCTSAGYRRKTCMACGDVSEQVIPASTNYCVYPEENYTVKTASTCVSEGVLQCVCAVCGNTVKERKSAIDPNAHVMGEWTIESEGTCITTGSKSRTCQSCGYVENVVTEAKGHNFLTETTKKATINTCLVCGMVETNTTSKSGTTKTVSSGKFSLVFEGFTSDKSVFFSAKTMDTEEYNAKIADYDKQLSAAGMGSVDSAYNLVLKFGDVDASITTASEMKIELGEENKKVAFSVWYLCIDGSLKQVPDKNISRKGTTITVKVDATTFTNPSGSVVLVNTGAKKGGWVLPVSIGAVTLVIGIGVAFYFISNSKKGKQAF